MSSQPTYSHRRPPTFFMSNILVTPAMTSSEEQSRFSEEQPLVLHQMQHILDSMGVNKYEPRVATQLLEFTHRIISEVLTDAQQYSRHADKPTVDKDDIRLAMKSRTSFDCTQPPPKDLLFELASKRNIKPLPGIPNDALGVHLPSKNQQLTMRNYTVLTKKQVEMAHPRGYNPAAGGGGKQPREVPKDPTKHSRMAKNQIPVKINMKRKADDMS